MNQDKKFSGLVCEGEMTVDRPSFFNDNRFFIPLFWFNPLVDDYGFWINLPDGDYRQTVQSFLNGQKVEIHENKLVLIVPDQYGSYFESDQELVDRYTFKSEYDCFETSIEGSIPVQVKILRDTIKILKVNSYRNKLIGSYRKYQIQFSTEIQLGADCIPNITEEELWNGVSTIYNPSYSRVQICFRTVKAILNNLEKIIYCDERRFLMPKPTDAESWKRAVYLREFSKSQLNMRFFLDYMQLLGQGADECNVAAEMQEKLSQFDRIDFGSRFLQPVGYMNIEGWSLLVLNFGDLGDCYSSYCSFCKNAHKAASFLSNRAQFFGRTGKIRNFHFKEGDWSIKFTQSMRSARRLPGKIWAYGLLADNSNSGNQQMDSAKLFALTIGYMNDFARLIESFACFMERVLVSGINCSEKNEKEFNIKEALHEVLIEKVNLDPMGFANCDKPFIAEYARAILNGFV